VVRVDAKRSRIDLLLSLAEPMLRSYNDGPFTLYEEVIPTTTSRPSPSTT
jgi:hypothetical protein